MPFCSAITNHCCIGVKQNYKPCCRFVDEETPFYADEHTFSEYKKSKFFVELEKELEQGWPKGCVRCQQEEQQGLTSLRERYNNRMSGIRDRIEFIDISMSNSCNLTCKMCENVSSSKWQSVIDENKELLIYNFDKLPNLTKNLPIANIFGDKNINLDDLHTVKYLGGEPFITAELCDLIDFFNDKDLMGKINFRCNTNCTFFPKKLIDQLLKFKTLRIDLSVDGLGDLCNFIRTGKDWKTVNGVIQKWKDLRTENNKIALVLHHTSQALNIHQFDDIKRFAEENSFHFSYSLLHHPVYLDFTVLPKNYVNELISKGILIDKKIIEILSKTPYIKENKDKFVNYLNDTDRILKTDLKKVIPLLHDYIQLS